MITKKECLTRDFRVNSNTVSYENLLSPGSMTSLFVDLRLVIMNKTVSYSNFGKKHCRQLPVVETDELEGDFIRECRIFGKS